jgi:hypothetical protein
MENSASRPIFENFLATANAARAEEFIAPPPQNLAGRFAAVDRFLDM